MKAAETIIIVNVLIAAVSLRSYGQMIFPINNPYAASDLQQLAAFEEGCRRIAEATTTPQVQEAAAQFPGLSTADGSAQLFQSTLQSYQNMAAQNQLAYQQLDRITEDVKKIRSGNYTQADVARWQEQADNASRVSAMADAYNSTYQMQSQQLERDQKRAANRELYNSTGKEYWQYTNRPVTPGSEQDAYDRANQVYRRW